MYQQTSIDIVNQVPKPKRCH